eukprot:7382717-Prymnesium_polylepis.2
MSSRFRPTLTSHSKCAAARPRPTVDGEATVGFPCPSDCAARCPARSTHLAGMRLCNRKASPGKGDQALSAQPHQSLEAHQQYSVHQPIRCGKGTDRGTGAAPSPATFATQRVAPPTTRQTGSAAVT